MQERHSNRLQYFNELANTAREYYIDYLKTHIDISGLLVKFQDESFVSH